MTITSLSRRLDRLSMLAARQEPEPEPELYSQRWLKLLTILGDRNTADIPEAWRSIAEQCREAAAVLREYHTWLAATGAHGPHVEGHCNGCLVVFSAAYHAKPGDPWYDHNPIGYYGRNEADGIREAWEMDRRAAATCPESKNREP
jgi:hypothetical protein